MESAMIEAVALLVIVAVGIGVAAVLVGRSEGGRAAGLATFLWRRKAWWILPLIVILVALVALVLLAHEGVSLPFIYTR